MNTHTTSDIAIAAGGVVLRPALTGHEVALVYRARYDNWSFPKGGLDPGERIEAAALREVHEETGLRCRIHDYLGALVYDDEVVRPKRTHYWMMSVITEEPFSATNEIDDRRWYPLAAAATVLSRPADRALLERL